MMIEMDEEVDMNICDDEEDPYSSITALITPKSDEQNSSTTVPVKAAVISKEEKLQIDKQLNRQTKLKDASLLKEGIPSCKLDQKISTGKKITADSSKGNKVEKKTIDFLDEGEEEKSLIIKKEKEILKKKGVQSKDEEVKQIKQDDDDINEVAKEEEVTKPKHKTLTFQEDPMQFHAKPRDLAKNALKRPREMDMASDVAVAAAAASHIFSRVAFSALPLDPKLAGLLEKSVAEVI